MNVARLFDVSHPLPSDYRAYRNSVDTRLLRTLRQNSGRRFLEIGVGPTFRQERLKTLDDLGIHDVGFDFEHVCANAGPTCTRQVSPIETSGFREISQEHTCLT